MCIKKYFYQGWDPHFLFLKNVCASVFFICVNTVVLFLCCFKQERRTRYLDRFRTRENTFLASIEDGVFKSLYEAKDYAHKNHNLALQWDMGKVKITQWRENDNLVQYLIDNLATKSHSWAMRELKSYFGDNQGLSKKIKKVAESMVREASKPHLGDQQFEQWPQQPMYMQPMGMSMQPMGLSMPPQRGFNGQQESNGQLCFSCQMPGHLQRNCPYGPPIQNSGKGRGGGRFGNRKFSGKRGRG